MADTQELALSIAPIIRYPRQAEVGKTYLMTIDLQPSSDEWPYEEEEYPIYCMLDTSPLFSCQPLGEPAVVLHRFGGSYGAAEFLLTAAPEEMHGEITVTLVNNWGVPIRVLSLDQISVTQVVTDSLKTIVTKKLSTSVPQILRENSSTNYTRNPYIIGIRINTPEKLFGREAIFRNIEESLQQDAKFILLHGQRRIGKSSILLNIPFFISTDEFVFVYYDLQEHSHSSVNEILYAIARAIGEHLQLENSTLNSLLNTDLENIRSIFSLIFLPLVDEAIGNKKLVLLLDEFDVVAGNETKTSVEFLRLLENLVKQQEKLCVIAVVSHYLNSMPSLLQLFRDSPVIKIGLLDELSAKQLITQPTEGILTYEPDAIQAILELSSGHPSFTQLICFELFNQARNQDNWNVTHESVKNIVNQVIEIADAVSSSLFDCLTTTEQVVFSAVAEAQKQNRSEDPLDLLEDYGLVITDALQGSIQSLIHQDFLNINPIKIQVELIRLWLLQCHPLRYVIRYLEIHNSQDPLEPFVGRESEIDAAFEQISNRGHLAIWGSRGMGKTSFLQKLESPQAWEDHGIDRSQAVIVRFSCKRIVPFSPSGFWKKVLRLLMHNLHAEPELQADIETLLAKGQTSSDSLRQVLRKLGRRNKFLVLLVDDFDVALVQNPEYLEHEMQIFLNQFRTLAVHSPERKSLSIIVTSLKRLNELGPKLNPNVSPWYNHYLFQAIKPFDYSEIDQSLQSFKIPITPEIHDIIKQITGGNPTLLKIISPLISRELERLNPVDPQELVDQMESSTREFLRSIWQNFSELEQTLLMLIALFDFNKLLYQRLRVRLIDFNLMFSVNERELITLEEQGILTQTFDKGKKIYSLSSSMMQFWIIQELQQTDEEWLQAREKVFLKVMSRQQMDKLTKDIKWLWNNKNQIPSNLEWFVKLVNAIQQII